MNPDHATSVLSVSGRRRRWVVVAVTLLSLLVGCAGFSIVQYRRTSAARLREARAVASLRSLGGEIVDRPIELLPLGGLFPGSGVAPFRLAIKLRHPGVTDDHLAVLDDFAADRVSELDFINCVAGDATLARAGRFRKLTLLGLGQARNRKDEPWPTGPTGLLTDAGFEYLDRLPDLEIVGLHGPDVTDRALARSQWRPESPYSDPVRLEGDGGRARRARAQARAVDTQARRDAVWGRRLDRPRTVPVARNARPA